MYILNKKKSTCVRIREKITEEMKNNGKYVRTGKTLINLACFIEHSRNAKRAKDNNIHDYSNKNNLNKKKKHHIVTVVIRDRYDISYVSNFMKKGTFTIIHLGLLSDADKMDWYNEMDTVIRFYGRIEYIEPDVYALVPLEVTYKKDVPLNEKTKVNRLK